MSTKEVGDFAGNQRDVARDPERSRRIGSARLVGRDARRVSRGVLFLLCIIALRAEGAAKERSKGSRGGY
jgi:hypothetical protein